MSPRSSPATTSTLACTRLSVAYDRRTVVRDVDLVVERGEFVALLGANGSGKSTLIKAALGLVSPTGGTIDVFGEPIGRAESWRRIGYVPQRSSAAPGVPATVAEVVTSGRLAGRRFFGWPSRADRTVVADAIGRVGLSDRSSSRVSDLSGGQHQRVMIARALASDAEFLVMDEPTAGVDHDHQASLARLIAGLVDGGTTVLLVAHELGPLRPLLDRAVVLADGRKTYDGPVEGIDRRVHEEHEHTHHHAEPVRSAEPLETEGIWP